MDAATGEAVQVQRLHRDERLALARLHLRDVALVEHDPAHQLDVEEPHADRAPERLAHRGVRLEDELLERLAVLDPLLELGGLAGELVVRELLEVGLERADVRGLLAEALEPAALADAEDALELPEVTAWTSGLGYRLGALANRGSPTRGRFTGSTPLRRRRIAAHIFLTTARIARS